MVIMKLQPEHFEKIKSGEKTYEIRINDEKRQQINVGDIVVFKKEPDLYEGIVVRVLEKRLFPSFAQMSQVMSLKELGFEGKNAEQVERILHKYYSRDEEESYGVVVFKIQVVN